MNRKIQWWAIGLAIAFLFFVFFGRIIHFYTNWLWFREVGYATVFWKIFLTRIGLGGAAFLVFFLLLYSNIVIARTLAPKYRVVHQEDKLEWVKQKVERGLIYILLGLAIFFALVAAGNASTQWENYLKFSNRTSFGLTEPVFKIDLGFYIFSLPFYHYIFYWILASLLVTLAVVVFIHWFDGAIQIRRDIQRFAPHVKAHLSVLLSLIFLTLAFGYRLRMFNLLYSRKGAAFGASYTDIHANLPALWILFAITILGAIIFLVNIRFKGWRLPIISFFLLVGTSLLVGTTYPTLVQQFRVAPNEIDMEKPYFRRNILHTRKAYNLDKIQETKFSVEEDLTLDQVRENKATINNIRLWDWRPLLKTYGQIQEIRLYYTFKDVDVDRYQINGEQKQVTLSARELSLEQLPSKAKTWVNERTVYTHGYGITMNLATEVTEEGLPNLIIKDLPPVSTKNIEVRQPQIYYGEAEGQYAIVNTKNREFDYPRGDKNEYTTYRGKGGVRVGSFFQRLAFALRFSNINILLTGAIKPESKIMFYRQIQDRVRTVAPFLLYDDDPYLVLSEGKIYWIQDAYTISNQYPYSEPFAPQVLQEGLKLGRRLNPSYNYIRNSVKVVIDAYTGDIDYYVVDPKDPIVKTYKKIFPRLFKKFKEMPEDLQNHVRYPEDLFMVQARMYTTYHMQDPQVFYNKEDLWNLPEEIFDEQRQPMEAYYVIIKLPGAEDEDFMLMLPFTPSTRDNMISWLGAKSDPDNYGELVVYQFPKEKLVYGPMQIEARIDQNPTISEQFTLWSQRGSRVIRGNLLVIPIGNSLIYVEPVYLQSEQSRLPELKRVIVAYGSRIAMEEDFTKALEEAFTGRTSAKKEKAKPEVAVESEVKVGLDTLAKEANERYQKAIEAQKRGDWTTYGEEIGKLEEVLKKMEEVTKK